MEKKEFAVRLYAGIFFVIGIVLILTVVFSIGMDKGITQPKFTLNVLFQEVGGLTVGAPVYLSGVTVGTVGKIDFLPKEIVGRNVIVTLNLFKRYKDQITRSYSFRIATQGILGRKIIDISIDRTGQNRTIVMEGPIVGEDPLDVQDLAKTFGQTAVSLKEAANSIDDAAWNLQEKFETMKRVFNRLEQRMIEGSLFRVF